MSVLVQKCEENIDRIQALMDENIGRLQALIDDPEGDRDFKLAYLAEKTTIFNSLSAEKIEWIKLLRSNGKLIILIITIKSVLLPYYLFSLDLTTI